MNNLQKKIEAYKKINSLNKEYLGLSNSIKQNNKNIIHSLVCIVEQSMQVVPYRIL